ncbi:MAG TPA: tRNA preQ1(34) S-adenosylmethionine ribosyltransferase-isomerase QueA [Spirochaetia bacterium]|nr:tRNA preQ1(34) S-adenosylmethionine ribosyltransferase-isomerase QueA [Spirochaetia bacterium]HRZ64361.1 tRNA preQ1(34) S-adenosylmethionine ribosyltransferase-isomerase QueA [Spirochaetia bacterium]
MKTDDFNFDLPEELVAQDPPERRGESRLLVLDRASGSLSHSMVRDLPGWIEPGSLMVFNDSRVRKARLYGQALDTGARVEFLLLRRRAPDEWEAAATKLKRQRPGRRYAFPEGVEAEVLPDPVGAGADTRRLRFEPPIDEAYLERVGHVPLPPYIKRDDRPADEERYQTVYSRAVGSAACPTAGLHFTEELLAALDGRGVERATLTLHVGMGTFLPVRSENVEDHAMHEEEYTVSEAAAAAVMRAKAEGRPVIAVGTTSLRTLESAWGVEGLAAGSGSTRIFIYPGYRFKAVDRLFTNFHTPRSTLLMLVSAFAGRERVLEAYAEAVRGRYRFFSYGDAMLIR